MKNVALLYGGQPRNFPDSWFNHREMILDCLPPDTHVDVFAHIWHDPTLDGKYYWDAYPKRGKWDAKICDKINEIIKPTAMQCEEPKKFPELDDIRPDPRFPHPMHNTACMFYSRQKVCDLFLNHTILNNVKYDCVISLRTDLHFSKPIGSVFSYPMDGVNVHSEVCHLNYGLRDHFGFGDQESMICYMSVFNNIRELVRSGCAVNPECLLGYQLVINDIKIYRQPLWDGSQILYRDL